MYNHTKGFKKKNGDEMWDEVAKKIANMINDDYAIVYMDFKVDVERLVKELKKAGLSDVKAYHGRLSSEMKSKVDNEFRSKEFQVLVATEAYEVGTHSPHVNLVLRVGCMRNIAVLVQEFGRAGRNNYSSDGIILANESIDDQRLIYWTKGCSSCEANAKKTEYEKCWKWLYGLQAGTCLRKSLLENFESSDIFEQATSGECCSSCDISTSRNFNCRQSAVLLLKALDEVSKLPVVKSVSEDKVIAWLRGSKQGWISSSDIQEFLDSSQSYSKGAMLNGAPLKKEWWSTHLRQLVHLGLVKISFNIYNLKWFSKASRSYSATENGKAFIENPHDLFVLNPDVFEENKSKGAMPSRPRKSANRSKHHLPKIRDLLTNRNRWSDIKDKGSYEYPGFTETDNSISYCPDSTKREELGSSQRPHFMWDDCQLTKRGCSTQKLFVKTGTEKTEVWVRRAFCEGVKVCSSEGCQYTVSNRQRRNKCRDHSSSHALKQTGNCPAQIIYLWPVVDDGRRWIGCLPGTTHNHTKPAPHHISQSVKDEIQAAIRKDCTLTTKQLQKGHGIGFILAEKSPAASNPGRIRKERQLALEGRSKMHPDLIPLLQVMEFDDFRKEYENIRDPSVDVEFLGKVNEKMGKYQTEGREYLISPSRNFVFFVAPYQADLLTVTKDLYVDITYTNNNGFPY